MFRRMTKTDDTLVAPWLRAAIALLGIFGWLALELARHAGH